MTDRATRVKVVSLDGARALARDEFGREIVVRNDIRRGPDPFVGEQWIIDRALGQWTFAARVGPSLAPDSGVGTGSDHTHHGVGTGSQVLSLYGDDEEPSASGDYAVAGGALALASSEDTVAIGHAAQAGGANTTVIVPDGPGYWTLEFDGSEAGYHWVYVGPFHLEPDGMGALAFGGGAEATGRDAIAIGRGASAVSPSTGGFGNPGAAIAIGRDASAQQDAAVAMGFRASVSSGDGVAIGEEAKASGYGIALGPFAGWSDIDTNNNIVVGYNQYPYGGDNTIIGAGYGSSSTDYVNDCVLIGGGSWGTATNGPTDQGTALGSAVISGRGNIAIGPGGSSAATAGGYWDGVSHGDDAVSIGSGTYAESDKAVAIGPDSWGAGESSIGIGDNAFAGDNGFYSGVVTWGNTAIGAGSGAQRDASTALGPGALALSTDSIAVGDGAMVEDGPALTPWDNFRSIAIGEGSRVGVFYYWHDEGYPQVVIYGQSPYSMAMGPRAVVLGEGSIAIGDHAWVGVTGAMPSATATPAVASVAIGRAAVATASHAVAVGEGSSALHDSSSAIGAGAVTTAVNQVMIGRTGDGVVTPGNVQVGGASKTVGFYGLAGTTKPTITGSRAGNAALASLLTALANQGLIANSTT